MGKFELTKGNRFMKDTGMEEVLSEGFRKVGDRITAQVSAPNIKKVFENYLAFMDKEEDMYFFLRLPYRNDEEDRQGTGMKLYFIDHLNPYHAMRILEVFGEVLIHDGISHFGFGTEDSEMAKGDCNLVKLFMDREGVSPETIFTILSIPQKDEFFFAENLSGDDNPIVSQNYYDEEGHSIYDVIATLEGAGLHEVKDGDEGRYWYEDEEDDEDPLSLITIALDQHRDDEEGSFDYHEELTIQRKGEKARHIRVLNGLKVDATYELKDLISAFLDSLPPDLFAEIEGNPPDVMTDTPYYMTYTIHMETESESTRDISGTYDKRGLPTDWPVFAVQLGTVLHALGIGTLFDESRFTHTLRRKNELIFYYVTFEEYGPEYCYLSDTDLYQPGDEVVVPAGKENRETIAVIERMEYHTKKEAPLPLKKIKKIIRANDGRPLKGNGKYAQYLHHYVTITDDEGNMSSGYVMEYYPEGEEHPWDDGATDECLCLHLPGTEELYIFHAEDIDTIEMDD